MGTSYAVGYAGATVERPDRDLPAISKVFQYAAIVDDGSTLSKLMLAFLVGLVGVGHLAQTTDDDLGCQRETILDIVIDRLLKFELRKDLFRPRIFGDRIASRIGRLHCFKQDRSLFLRGVKPNLSGQLHTGWNVASRHKFQLVDRRIPPTAKAVGFLRSPKLNLFS